MRDNIQYALIIIALVLSIFALWQYLDVTVG